MNMRKTMLLVAIFMAVFVIRASAAVPSAPPTGLKDLGIDATLQLGSPYSTFNVDNAFLLKEGKRTGEYKDSFAVHTDMTEPWFIIILKEPASIKTIYIQNRPDGSQERALGLTVSVSEDQKTWKEIWKAADVRAEWTIDLKTPEKAKFLKFELPRGEASYLHLNNVRIYGN